jgi:hypothetical protein
MVPFLIRWPLNGDSREINGQNMSIYKVREFLGNMTGG